MTFTEPMRSFTRRFSAHRCAPLRIASHINATFSFVPFSRRFASLRSDTQCLAARRAASHLVASVHLSVSRASPRSASRHFAALRDASQVNVQ